MAISNKLQLSNLYIRSAKQLASTSTAKPRGIDIYNTIHRECNKPLQSKLAVQAIKVHKANNYDIVKESQKLYRLQCKYNTSNFEEIRLRQQQQRKRIEDAIEERERRELAKRNAIARAEATQTYGVKTFNKNVFSEAFAFHQHSNIIKMACS